MSEALHWTAYYKEMEKNAPLKIYYPICGGGEECIFVCPYADSIWEVVPMEVSLFGVRHKVRLRPFMANPEACKKCYLCVQACPTGALRPAEEEIKRPALVLLYNALRLPFKKRYGLKFVFRKEHGEKFKRNNWPERYGVV
ncbi:ferredoxin family protein [Thermococcus sp. Bubb.Bath]|uniref:4Fe-4S dicluster domain-containing protein n=1 Tax=Thermococcus sp. Bubb.Bath TaxID=1638242 RepID=UPI001438CB83|nr:ferredoxin family protein [Thermococcus sp. Bubb.Bath]NJF24599.1 ferredoxin family protein [Thermococcus sp. Bubb.Bath]